MSVRPAVSVVPSWAGLPTVPVLLRLATPDGIGGAGGIARFDLPLSDLLRGKVVIAAPAGARRSWSGAAPVEVAPLRAEVLAAGAAPLEFGVAVP